MQQAPAPAADPNAQRWAEYYERDPATALQNGYTKAHYNAYLASKGPPPRAPAPVAPQASQVSANDEAWARLYEADPAQASGSGYTKAHYDGYLQKKGGAAPAPAAPAPAAPQATNGETKESARDSVVIESLQGGGVEERNEVIVTRISDLLSVKLISHHKGTFLLRRIFSFHKTRNPIEYIHLRSSSKLFYSALPQPPPLWTSYPNSNHATLQSLVDRLEELRGDEESSGSVPSVLLIEEGEHCHCTSKWQRGDRREGQYVKVKKF